MPNIKSIVDRYKKQIDKKNQLIETLLKSFSNYELLSQIIKKIIIKQKGLKGALSEQISYLTTSYRKYRQFEDYKELRKYKTVKQYINFNRKVKEYRKELKSIEQTLSTLRSLKNKVKG